jgi:LysM domain
MFFVIITLAMACRLQAQTNGTDEPAFRSEDGQFFRKIIDPELRAIVKSTITNWNAGRTNASDIAKYVQSFDDLLARHQGEKTEAVAQILYAKENFYYDVLGDCDAGSELLHQLARDYPHTELGKGVGQILENNEMEDKPPVSSPTDGNPVGRAGAAFLFSTNAEPGSTFEIGVYVVKTGDTLVRIAAHFQTTVEGLQALNPDMKTPHISVGQQIRVYERKI